MRQQKWQKRENVGEFGKYGENDNFATIANKAKHKAVKYSANYTIVTQSNTKA